MRLLFGIAAIVLAGCSVSVIDYRNMTPLELSARPEYVAILPSVPKEAKTIGPVKASLCQKLKEDRAYDADDVYLELKRQTALAGGNGIANVSLSVIDKGTRTCFWSGSASGIAWYRPPQK
jgi:hypothetical protein